MGSFFKVMGSASVADSMRSINGQELGSVEVAQDQWVSAPGTHEHHRSTHEHRVLCWTLQNGAQYDGINVKRSAALQYNDGRQRLFV